MKENKSVYSAHKWEIEHLNHRLTVESHQEYRHSNHKTKNKNFSMYNKILKKKMKFSKILFLYRIQNFK